MRTFFSDKDYFRLLWVIALPLVLQQAITASVNLIDTLMVGSFGDASLAAVNLSNQFYFFFNMIIYGTVGGGAILNAQFWGKKDRENMYRVMGLQFIGCACIGLTFATLALTIPEKILGLYSKDEAVIAIGANYLRTLAPSYLLYAIGQVYCSAMRCSGNTRIPMLVSCAALLINITLNYLLIFGKLGFPRLGITGVAIATLTARAFEFVLYLSFTYLGHLPVAAPLRSMFSFNGALTRLTLKKMVPVAINEGIWGLGTNVYAAIYAGISTISIAAYGAVSPIDSLAFTIFTGIGDALGIIVGNALGAKKPGKAYEYGKRTTILSFCLSLLIGGVILICRYPILSIYNLSPEATSYAAVILTIMACSFWARTTNYTIFMGALRAGGDTTFCLMMDAGIMWLVGIPTAWVLANVFHLPVTIVYLAVMLEEAIKFFLIVHRFRSKKWVTDLVN